MRVFGADEFHDVHDVHEAHDVQDDLEELLDDIFEWANWKWKIFKNLLRQENLVFACHDVELFGAKRRL